MFLLVMEHRAASKVNEVGHIFITKGHEQGQRVEDATLCAMREQKLHTHVLRSALRFLERYIRNEDTGNSLLS